MMQDSMDGMTMTSDDDGVTSIVASPKTPSPSQGDPVKLQAQLQRLREKQASLATPKTTNAQFSYKTTTAMDTDKSSSITITPFDPAIHTALDAENAPTVLYQKLLRKNFRGALKRCQEAPQEIEMWIYKQSTQNSPKDDEDTKEAAADIPKQEEPKKDVKWRLLPIHAAIVLDAPLSLMEHLANPSTVRCPDDEGSLPLHLACRLGSPVAVVRLLLKQFPQSVHIPDASGATPWQIVQKNPHSAHHASLEYALEKCRQSLASSNPHNASPMAQSLFSSDNSTVDTKGLSTQGDDSSPSHHNVMVDDTSSKLSEALTSLGELRQRECFWSNHNNNSNNQTNSHPPSVAEVNTQCSADDSSIGDGGGVVVPHETNKSPLLECKERHLAELLECKEQHARAMEGVQRDNHESFQKQLQQLTAQHAREMSLLAEQNEQQLQEQDRKEQSNVTTDESSNEGPLSASTDFNHEFLKLKMLHSAQVKQLHEDAQESHQDAEWRVQAKFQRKVQRMEQRQKKEFIAVLGAPSPEPETASLPSRHSTPTTVRVQHQSTAGSLSSLPQFHHLSEDNQKLFEETLNAMQTAFRQEVHNFKHQMEVTKDEGDQFFSRHSAEHKRQYTADMAAMDQRYAAKITGLVSLLGDLHNELSQVRQESRRQSMKWDAQMRAMDGKVEKVGKTSRSHIKKKFQTIQRQMSNHQEDANVLKDHVEELEDRLLDQKIRGQALEERVKEMRNSWLMCLG